MDNQLFERSARISANTVADLALESWLPPVISQAQHVVHAERRSGGHGAAGFVGSNGLMDANAPLQQSGAAVSDVEQVLEEARLQGFAKGEKEGFTKGREEGELQGREEGVLLGEAAGKKLALEQMATDQERLQQQGQQLASLLTHLSESLNQHDYQLEQALLNITQALAKAVIKQEMRINPAHIMATVKEAVASLPLARDNLKLYCHSDDLDVIKRVVPAGETWQLIADEELDPGGCRVTTDQSIIDYSVSARFEEAANLILRRQIEHLNSQHPDFELAPEPVSSVLTDSAQTHEESSESAAAVSDVSAE